MRGVIIEDENWTPLMALLACQAEYAQKNHGRNAMEANATADPQSSTVVLALQIREWSRCESPREIEYGCV
jgi:hypothetical protein